jgi:hypothetical protein
MDDSCDTLYGSVEVMGFGRIGNYKLDMAAFGVLGNKVIL